MQSTEPETWLPIPGYEGRYEVSDHGKVKSLARCDTLGRPLPAALMALRVTRKGYRTVRLSLNGKKRHWYVHLLVMLAFCGPKPAGLDTRHMDGNPANNHVSNLRYGTRSQNIRDQVVHGTHGKIVRTHCPQGHPYHGVNLYRAPDGERRCRECSRMSSAPSRERAKAKIACGECGKQITAASLRKHQRIWHEGIRDVPRLTEADVRAIRASTLSPRELAERYGVTASAVRKVIARTTWRHVVSQDEYEEIAS